MAVTSTLTMAQWAAKAVLYPQTHPQTLEEMGEYQKTYGEQPDSQITAPWCFQQSVPTPEEWTAPVHVPVGTYYDPIAGEVYLYGSQEGNPFDPTLMDPQPTLYHNQR